MLGFFIVSSLSPPVSFSSLSAPVISFVRSRQRPQVVPTALAPPNYYFDQGHPIPGQLSSPQARASRPRLLGLTDFTGIFSLDIEVLFSSSSPPFLLPHSYSASVCVSSLGSSSIRHTLNQLEPERQSKGWIELSSSLSSPEGSTRLDSRGPSSPSLIFSI